MRNKLILFVILFGIQQLNAEISIFFFKGQIILHESSGKKTILKQHNIVLKEGASLELKANSEVILINEKMQFAILIRAKIYSLEEIRKSINMQKKEGLISSLLVELVKEFNDKTPDIRKYPERYIQAKGGVSRGQVFSLISPVNNSFLTINDLKFNWHSNGIPQTFSINVWTKHPVSASVSVLKRVISDTMFVPDLNLFKEGVTYNWSLTLAGNAESNVQEFTILTENEKERLKENITDSLKVVLDPKEKLLRQAILFEDANLFIDADNCYLELEKTYPQDYYILDLHKLFKLRTNSF